MIRDANLPFTAAGLQMGWYSVFGNHDNEVQGSLPIEWRWQLIALGERKVFGLDVIEEYCGPPPEAVANTWAPLDLRAGREPDVRIVPSDRNRRLVSHRAFMRSHFATQGTPVGHGFRWANVLQDRGYYSFAPAPGLHIIVLDTLNEDGGAGGSMDAPQLAWLEEQLIAHSSHYFDPAGNLIPTGNEDSLLVILSHHHDPLFLPRSESAPGDWDISATPLEILLHRFPNVILHVAGHTHEHRVSPRPDPTGWTQGYWEIITASQADWPQQGRLLEIVDNEDGSLSIFSTIVDHSGPADPAQAIDPTPQDSVNELQLAAISRQVAFLDPQAGDNGARGTLLDRNVELLIRDPRPQAE